jgi:enoyl-[acyl-carrier-protein] reductase (NADH)
VIVNGKRYKVPVIESENGWKWNVASIMPVIKIYTRADMAIEKLEKEIEDFEKKTKEYYVSGMSPVAYNNKINKDIDRIRQEIVYSAKKLDGYVATLKDDPDNKRLKQDIHNIRAELTKLRQELNSLNNKLITKDKILKYTDIKRELDARVRQKEREEIVLEKNEESFISISDALVRALTSKKVLLS